MKKIIIVVVIIGAGFFGVAPYFIGQQAETKFREIYTRMNTTPEMRIEVTEYQRGWFSSQATVELEIQMLAFDESANDSVLLTLHNDISHGPLLTKMSSTELGLLDMDTNIEFPEQMLEDMPELNNSFNDVLSLKNRFYFDGSSKNITKTKEASFTIGALKFVVSPADFVAHNSAAGNVIANGTWDGFSMTDNGTFGMTMGRMKFDFDLTSTTGSIYDINALYTGTFSMDMDELRVTAQQMPGMVELKNLTVTSDTQIENNLIFGDADMTIANINAIGLNFTNFILQQSISNMDVEFIQQINQLNRQITGDNMEAKITEIVQHMMRMLEKSPQYEMRQLAFDTAQGTISSELTASVDVSLLDTTNSESIAQAGIIDASGSIPLAFVTAMGVMPMVQPFIDQGYLINDGEFLTFDFSYKKGQMLLSGKPLPMQQQQPL